MAYGTSGHTDRTEKIAAVAIVMVLGRPVIRRDNDRHLPREPITEVSARDRMNVTEGQANIDGERKQRNPRTTSDMVTKPTHHSRVDFSRFSGILASTPARSTKTRALPILEPTKLRSEFVSLRHTAVF